MILYVTMFSLTFVMCTALSDSVIYDDNNDSQTDYVERFEQRMTQILQQTDLPSLNNKHGTEPKENLQLAPVDIQSGKAFLLDLYRYLEVVDRSVDDKLYYIRNKTSAAILGLDPAKVERAEVITCFPNNVQKASTFGRKHGMTFYFEVPQPAHVIGAELRIFKEISPVFKSGIFSINLYVIKSGQNRRSRTISLESTLNVEWNTTGWLVLDATKAARNWTTNPHLNMGLYLGVVDPQGKIHKPQDIGITGRKGSANTWSFFVVYFSRRIISSVQARSKTRWTDGVET